MAPLILLFISLIGAILIRKFTKENRFFILIPAGMIWGVSCYIFLLNIISKILPGGVGIIISSLSFLALGILTFIFTKPKKIIFSGLVNFLTLILIVLIVFYLARLKMTSVLPVADSDMQWAYAASFARGNYPAKTPWQPNLNPNYHLGAYFLEGAILSLTNLPLITIHSILNVYFLMAGILFTIFLLWETKYYLKNLWLIIAALVTYISFGVTILVIPTLNFFSLNNLVNAFTSLTTYPGDFFAKGIAGASLVDLNSLSYLPARSLSLGLAFLTLYFTFTEFKNRKVKTFFLIILFAVMALVEESMFLGIFMVLVEISLFSFFPFLPIFKDLIKERRTLLKIIIATLIAIFLQGGFFSDFGSNQSAFHLNLPFTSSFYSQLHVLINTSILNAKSFIWILPSPLLLGILLLLYAIVRKNKLIGLFGLYSLSALICFLLIEYKYYPSNNIRFYNFGFIAAGIGLFYLLFNQLKSKSYRKSLLIFIFLIPILIPTLVPELLSQYHQIKEARIKNIRSQVLIDKNPNTPFEQISDWANKNLPKNGRLISVDTSLPTPLRSIQFEHKGIYTILGPQYTRVLRQEPGVEYYDLILTLNPQLLKQTKTEYIYIESESSSYQQLPEFRKNELENDKYFKVLKSIEHEGKFYRLYKILTAFTDTSSKIQETSENTLEQLQKKIPIKKSVYIGDYGENPNLSFWYRMTLTLALNDKDIRRNLSQTGYMVVETSIPYKSGNIMNVYDFYILGPNQKPPIQSKLIWSNIFASAWERY